MEFRDKKEENSNFIKDKYSKLQEKLKKAADGQVTRFNKDIDVFTSNSQDKSALDELNKKEYNDLEKRINTKKRRVEKFNDYLKQLKIKIKQNNEDWENKNKCIKNEKEKLMDSYKKLKKKMLAFRKGQVKIHNIV